MSISARPQNNALKLTALGGGQIGCGAPQLNAVLYDPHRQCGARMNTGRCLTFMLVSLLSVACIPSPDTEAVKNNDGKEDVNVFAVHCRAWAGSAPLQLHASIDVEDFGQATGSGIELAWDFGDGSTGREERPRPYTPNGRPVAYRFGKVVQHTFAKPGPYTFTGTAKNGARTSTCTAAVIMLPTESTGKHPQG